jgi:hypothetical protein
VIGAVLGVVFDDEDRGFLPELALGDGFDEQAEREIVRA